MKTKKRKAPIIKTLALTSIFLLQCQAAQLIVNGDFESGTFGGWTEDDQSGGIGDFYIDTPGTNSPVSLISTSSNPFGGSFYALSDTSGPGAHALSQAFTISSTPSSVILTFQMFVNNNGGSPIINPGGFDFNLYPNQYARVDILSGTASAFDIAGGVVANLYIGTDVGINPNTYTSYSFDITSAVSTPGTYRLRFAEVDNQGVINQGVDNVSVVATVPEPSVSILVIITLTVFLVVRRSGLGGSGPSAEAKGSSRSNL